MSAVLQIVRKANRTKYVIIFFIFAVVKFENSLTSIFIWVLFFRTSIKCFNNLLSFMAAFLKRMITSFRNLFCHHLYYAMVHVHVEFDDNIFILYWAIIIHCKITWGLQRDRSWGTELISEKLHTRYKTPCIRPFRINIGLPTSH